MFLWDRVRAAEAIKLDCVRFECVLKVDIWLWIFPARFVKLEFSLNVILHHSTNFFLLFKASQFLVQK